MSTPAARAFLQLLRQHGVTVTGTAKPRHRDSVDTESLRKEQEEPLTLTPATLRTVTTAPAGKRVLASHVSPPLIQDMTVTLKVSQNLHAELTLRIAALPYLHPNRFTYPFADPALMTATYAQRMRTVQADVYRRLIAGRSARDVMVFAAHLFVEGTTPSYSERKISIHADYAAEPADLPDVAYGALGHIHKPQMVARAGFPAYYAGSPLQMDFGETGDTKSVVLAEVGPGITPRIELVPLTSGRRLVRLEGTLEEIAQRAGRVGDAWVKAVVDVEFPDPSLTDSLARMLPQATVVTNIERRTGAASRVLDRETSTRELPDIEDLLREYLPGHGITGLALDRVMAAFAHLQAEPDPGDPAPCCEETLLTAALAGQPLDTIDRSSLLPGTDNPAAETTR